MIEGDERRRKEKEKDERRWNVLEGEGLKRKGEERRIKEKERDGRR